MKSAFEIVLDNEEIWSKLKTGKFPDPNEVIQLILKKEAEAKQKSS